jgi:hypothetical protein
MALHRVHRQSIQRTLEQSMTNSSSQNAVYGRSQGPVILIALMMLVLATLSCSVGQALVGEPSPAPTATKTPRPTFTPLPDILTPSPTPRLAVRGALPPGVTAQPPTDDRTGGGMATDAIALALEYQRGSTSVVLIATETPAPSATPGPTAAPSSTAPPTSDVETNRPTRAAGPRALPTPYAVVNAATLIGRRLPGKTFERLGQAVKGDELMILARTPDSDWWQVCCLANQPVWVPADQVTARGPLESLPVLTPPPTPPPTPRPLPPPTPLPTATRLPPFDVARGPEFPYPVDDGRMTIWAKVYEGLEPYEKPLPGYVLKIFRDGVDISSPQHSAGDQDFNKIYQTGRTDPVYEYNLKFEMPDAGEADWEIYLAKPDGYRVSEIKKFTTKGDSYRSLVLYIAYWLAR